MCGIIAYLGQVVGSTYVIEGIRLLMNRGYDSMGCASIEQPSGKGVKPRLHLTKYANRPKKDSYELLKENFDEHEGRSCLMAHCRWATTGMVNDVNSHPHVDTLSPARIAVIHNGIISNYASLREYLMGKGVVFQSETDTEVIVNLLSYYYANETKGNMMDALKMTIAELEGTWALVVMSLDEADTLYVCKKGSPILIGYSDEMAIVSSELLGFSNYLKNYHIVPDDHIIKIHLNRKVSSGVGKIEFYRDGSLTTLSSKTIIHQTLHATTPDPYPHWTIKEIMEQPEAAFRALNQGGRIFNHEQVRLGGLQNKTCELLQIRNLTLIASGTSYHAGMMGVKMFQSVSGFDTVRIIDSSEFCLSDLAPSHAGVLVLSQSGETRDVVRCLEMIREQRPEVLVFSIVNVVESLIAREADCGAYLNAGREVGVASTKSFTNQVIVLMLMATWFSQNRYLYPIVRAKLIRSLHNIEDLIRETLTMSQAACDRTVNELIKRKCQHLFILGRSSGFAAALEGALKIKELSYIHAEAYCGGGLKHGPLALITKGTPVIVIRSGDSEMISKQDIAAAETKTRGAYLISIGSQSGPKDLYDIEIMTAHDLHLANLLAVLPMQYLAYRLAIDLGYNCDFPRNLAKVCSVD